MEVTQALSLRKVPPDAFSEFPVPQNAVKSSLGLRLEKQEYVLTTMTLETLVQKYTEIQNYSVYPLQMKNKKIKNHQTQNVAASILKSEKVLHFMQPLI